MIIKTKSGKEKWVLMSAELISISGKKQYMLTTAFDITDKKKMEESLKQSEDRFKIVSELTSDFAYAFKFDDRGNAKTEWVSGAIEKITGYSRDQITEIGGWEKLIFKEDIKIAYEQLNQLLKGKPKTVEYRIINKNGKLLWVRDYAKSKLKKTTGKVEYIYGAMQDITEQKNAQEKIFVLNRTLRTISEINQLIVREFNKDKLLYETCKILVEHGKFASAWIGLVDEERKTIFPAAQYGFSKKYKHSLDLRFDNSNKGKGIVATAVRAGKDIICYDIKSDKRFSGWWKIIKGMGFGASAAFLLKIDHKIIGAINVNLASGAQLTKDMIDLLDELAGDISLALRLMGESNARTKAEESLKSANLVVESSPAVLFRWKAEAGWPVAYVSQNVKQFGYTPEELMTGKTSYTSVVHPDDLARVADEVKEHSESGVKKFRQEYRIVTKAGKTIWTDDRTTIERDSKGKIKFYQGVILDITEKKLAELSLAESERRYKHFVNQTSDGFYKLAAKTPVPLDADVDDQILLCYQNFYVEECNDVWAKMYGYRSCAEMMGVTLKKLYGSWDRSSNNQSLKEFLTSGYRVINSETVEYDKKNNKKYFINNYVGIIEDGFLKEIWGTQQDITEKKNAEEALKNSEERLRLALTSANQGLYDLNIQTGNAIVSAEYAAMLGYNPKTFKETNEKWLKRLHPDDREITGENYRAYTNGEIPEYHVEFRQRTKSKEWKWILSSGKVVEWDEKGNPVRMLGTHTDITDRKISEEELIQSEEKFRQLAENIRDAFWLFDYINQKVLYVSPAFETIWGRPAESVLKDYSVWNDSIYPDDLEYAAESMQQMINSGGGEVREYRIVRPNGEIRWINDRGWAIYDDAGKVIRVTGVAEDITEQKHAREALELSEKRYRHFVNQTSEGFYRLAAKEPIKIDASENTYMNRSFGSFYVAECNDVMAAMYGFKSSAEIKGLYLYELQSSWDEEISIKSFQQFVKSDLKVINNETIEYDKFGEQKYFLNNYVGIINNGMLVEIWGTQQDITSQKHAEDALIESERRFRSLFEHSAVGVAQIYTDTGRFFKINKKYAEIIGYSVDEMLKMNFQEITHPDDLQNDLEKMDELRKGEIDEYSIEKRYFHKNRSIVWVNLTVSPLWEQEEKPEFHIAVVEDITEKKYAEIAFRNSAMQYRLLFSGNPNPMFVWDRATLKFLDANEAAVKHYGYKREEFLKMTIKDIRPKEDIPAMLKVVADLNDGITRAKGYRHKKKNGEIIYVDVTSNSIEFNGRESEVVVVYDVTDRYIAEQALRESEEKFRSVFTDSHDCIYVTSSDGKIVNMNDAGLELFGISRKKLLNQSVLDLYTSEQERKEFKEKIDKDGFVKDYAVKLKNRSGKKLDCLITASVRKNALEEVISYQGIIRDITEQKKAEQDLIKAKEQAERADRLKTEFLAQMSHEIRTPINTLLSFSSLIREETKDIISDDLNQYFNYQVSAGNRIIRTIDLVLNMSEVQTGSFQLNMKKMNLVDLISEIYSDYKNIAEENGLVINLLSPENFLNIIGDEYSVHQIFSNLIDNSIKYTPDGSITLTIKKVTTKAVVEVIDTGIGMTKEYMNKIFQPFTQEEQGYTRRFEGSGLGLSLVKKYCDFNNAEISVESEKNMGTKFTVSFNLIE
jgi:PAS domain S-box-containing protein